MVYHSAPCVMGMSRQRQKMPGASAKVAADATATTAGAAGDAGAGGLPPADVEARCSVSPAALPTGHPAAAAAAAAWQCLAVTTRAGVAALADAEASSAAAAGAAAKMVSYPGCRALALVTAEQGSQLPPASASAAVGGSGTAWQGPQVPSAQLQRWRVVTLPAAAAVAAVAGRRSSEGQRAQRKLPLVHAGEIQQQKAVAAAAVWAEPLLAPAGVKLVSAPAAGHADARAPHHCGSSVGGSWRGGRRRLHRLLLLLLRPLLLPPLPLPAAGLLGAQALSHPSPSPLGAALRAMRGQRQGQMRHYGLGQAGQERKQRKQQCLRQSL